MLFNSYLYILGFLPITIVGYLLLGRFSKPWALGWLILASVVFYGWWRPLNILIIGPSLAVNFVLGRALLGIAADAGKARLRNVLLIGGIIFNVCFLGYFKYANFALSVANDVGGTEFVFKNIILPLGISFITFQKIAFLIDIVGGRIKSFTLRDFLLFVMFFPQLIAGPIVHYPETMPQFHRAETRYDPTLYAMGITLFCFGLFKKVVLADGIAAHVSPIYAYAATGEVVTLLQAWLAAVGFTLQIYFDFSGYSDMACGAALFFGIRLPLNFNSPLRATSIVDFWLRWHVTLTRFLTAYVFNAITLRLTRKRVMARRPMLKARGSNPLAFFHLIAWPILFTMLLSGVWHGAGYTFVVWGLMHGIYLVINHAWRQYGPMPENPAVPKSVWTLMASFLVTFLAVVVAQVVFRAPDMATAINVIKGMAGLGGISLPGKLAAVTGLAPMRVLEGVVDIREFATASAYLLVLLAIALIMPNSLQMMSRYDPVLQTPKPPPLIAGTRFAIYWRPSLTWMLFMAVLAGLSMLWLTGKSEFLYWQF